MKYKVRFNGELIDGLEKKAVIANLTKLGGWDRGTIEKKFFSGKPLVLKKLDDLQEAKRYQTIFAKAGIKVEIVDIDQRSTPPKPEKEKTVPAEPQKPKKGKRSSRLGLILLVILVLGAALAGAAYYWVQTQYLDTGVPASVNQAEDALASEDIFLLAHANVANISKIQDALFRIDEKDKAFEKHAEGVVADLVRSGIDIRKSLEHVLMAGYLQVQDKSAWASVVMIGDIPVEEVRAYIRNNYEMDTDRGGDNLYFRHQDPETCEYGPLLGISVASDQIVLSWADHLDGLLTRLQSKATAQQDLIYWREYRSSRVASAAVFSLQDTETLAKGKGMAGMMLAGAKKEIDPVEALFFGSTLKVVPASLILDLSMVSKQQQWITETAEKWNGKMAAYKAKAAGKMESAGMLFDNFSITPAAESIDMTLVLDKELAGNIKTLVSEVIGEMFSSGISSVGGSPQGDVIDENPIRYSETFSMASLGRFSDYESFPENWDWMEGPFAVKAEKAALTDEGLTEIFLKAEGRDLRNLGKYGDRVQLRITAVQGDQGQNLLREEKCGRKRNDKPAEFVNFMQGSTYQNTKLVHYVQAYADKSIRLKQGTTLEQVTGIIGAVVLNQPTRLERLELPVPLKGRRIEREDFLVTFKESGDQSISFVVNGNQARLIAVRALNKDKKHLQKGGSSSMGLFIGSGKSHSLDFSGTVAYAEVILAVEETKKEFPFTLTGILQGKGNGFPQPEKAIETLSLDQFDSQHGKDALIKFDEGSSWYGKPQVELHKGPVNLAVFQLRTSGFWGTTGTVQVKTPEIPVLANNLSAVEIVAANMITQSGKEITTDEKNYVLLKKGGSSFGRDQNDRFLEGQSQVIFDHKDDNDPVTTISGNINLRLPSEIASLELANFALGSSATDQAISLQLIERGRDYVLLKVDGGREKLIDFNVKNSKGDNISSFGADISKKDGKWLARVSYKGQPKKIEALYAPDQQIKSYPFTLNF